jgi:rhodanese-related sulfurtransferase
MKIHNTWQSLGQNFAAFCVFLLIAAIAGAAINHTRDHPLPLIYQSKAARLEHAVQTIAERSRTEKPPATVPVLNSNIPNVSLEKFKRFVDGRTGVIVDARPEIFYRLGHVPGALSLPRNDFEAAYAKLKSQLEKHRGQPLIVYCSDADCEDSELVATALSSLGFRQVTRFKGGWVDWTNAHLPEEKQP